MLAKLITEGLAWLKARMKPSTKSNQVPGFGGAGGYVARDAVQESTKKGVVGKLIQKRRKQ